MLFAVASPPARRDGGTFDKAAALYQGIYCHNNWQARPGKKKSKKTRTPTAPYRLSNAALPPLDSLLGQVVGLCWEVTVVAEGRWEGSMKFQRLAASTGRDGRGCESTLRNFHEFSIYAFLPPCFSVRRYTSKGIRTGKHSWEPRANFPAKIHETPQ